jgi:hypothetical protein
MKSRSLLSFLTVAFLYVLLGSNSGGPGQQANANYTGGPGSAGNCASCHSGGGGTTTGTIELRKASTGAAGPVVSSYLPDSFYIVTLSGNNTSLASFGFQLMALKLVNNTTNAGSFSNFPANTHLASVSGRNILEHSSALSKTNNQYEVSFTWKAPPAGTGDASFHGIINAVNNNGSTSGDKPGPAVTKQIAEAVINSVNDVSSGITIAAYPNPFRDQLTIGVTTIGTRASRVLVYDMRGMKIMDTQLSGGRDLTINTSTWQSGVYMVYTVGEHVQQAIPVVKK